MCRSNIEILSYHRFFVYNDTQLAHSFFFIFQKIDVMGKLVDDLIAKTHEYLQPNPGESVSYKSFLYPPSWAFVNL